MSGRTEGAADLMRPIKRLWLLLLWSFALNVTLLVVLLMEVR